MLHFDDFTKRRFDALKQKMELTDESLKATIDLIQHLNPNQAKEILQVMS